MLWHTEIFALFDSSWESGSTVLFRPSVHVMRHKPLWTEHLGNCHRSQLAVNIGWKMVNFKKNFSTRGPLKIEWTLAPMNTFFFMSQVIARSEHLSQWTLRVTCHNPWTVGQNSTVWRFVEPEEQSVRICKSCKREEWGVWRGGWNSNHPSLYQKWMFTPNMGMHRKNSRCFADT